MWCLLRRCNSCDTTTTSAGWFCFIPANNLCDEGGGESCDDGIHLTSCLWHWRYFFFISILPQVMSSAMCFVAAPELFLFYFHFAPGDVKCFVSFCFIFVPGDVKGSSRHQCQSQRRTDSFFSPHDFFPTFPTTAVQPGKVQTGKKPKWQPTINLCSNAGWTASVQPSTTVFCDLEPRNHRHQGKNQNNNQPVCWRTLWWL